MSMRQYEATGAQERNEAVEQNHAAQANANLVAENYKLRTALMRIVDGYGPNHGSKFCFDVSSAALADPPA